MGHWVRENTFVCLDDITCKFEEINPVIYNPRIITNIDDRKEMLSKCMREYLNIELTDEELDKLCRYESMPTFNSSVSNNESSEGSLGDFVIELRSIIETRK